MSAAFGESPALSTLITLEVTKNNAGQTFTCCWRQEYSRSYHARVIFLAYEAYQAGTDGRKLRQITITLIACLHHFIKFSISLTTWHYELMNLYHHSITLWVASILCTRSSIKRNARQLKPIHSECKQNRGNFLRGIRFSRENRKLRTNGMLV